MAKPKEDDESIGGNSAGLLRSLIQRIENQNERIADERLDLKEIYGEVKAHGFTPKIVRKLVARRAMEKAKRDEEDALLETYEGAVGLNAEDDE